jgi:hypothetical protein
VALLLEMIGLALPEDTTGVVLLLATTGAVLLDTIATGVLLLDTTGVDEDRILVKDDDALLGDELLVTTGAGPYCFVSSKR